MRARRDIGSFQPRLPPREALQRERALAVGTAFPDFVLHDLAGQPLALASRRGRVVLVVFLSAASPQSAAELPALREVYRQHHDRGFEIIGINLDAGQTNVAEYVQTHAISWPQGHEHRGPDHGLAGTHGIVFAPASYLLDRDGPVAARHVRATELDCAVRQLLARNHGSAHRSSR